MGLHSDSTLEPWVVLSGGSVIRFLCESIDSWTQNDTAVGQSFHSEASGNVDEGLDLESKDKN